MQLNGDLQETGEGGKLMYKHSMSPMGLDKTDIIGGRRKGLNYPKLHMHNNTPRAATVFGDINSRTFPGPREHFPNIYSA